MPPLEGIRVLDLTAALAGPAATQRLADWGADVVKVEPPGTGEWTRSHPIVNAWLDGETTVFLSLNRNKRSIQLDLRSTEGLQLLLRLVEVADVFAHNFRIGVVERLGITPEVLRDRNPGLIYAFATGYGAKGPTARRPGQDLLLQAYSGVMFSVGAEGDRPQPAPIFAADVITSHFLAEGVLAALVERARTGLGQVVEVSMLAAMLDSQAQELGTFLNLDVAPRRTSVPSAHALLNPPYGVYPTSDGWIAIAMAEPAALAAATGSDLIAELGTWERMADNRESVFREIERIVVQDTTAAWVQKFDHHGVWSGPVHRYEDLVEAPQIASNRYLVDIPSPGGGTMTVPDGAVTFSSHQPAHQAPPRLGADQEEVIAEWLRP